MLWCCKPAKSTYAGSQDLGGLFWGVSVDWNIRRLKLAYRSLQNLPYNLNMDRVSTYSGWSRRWPAGPTKWFNPRPKTVNRCPSCQEEHVLERGGRLLHSAKIEDWLLFLVGLLLCFCCLLFNTITKLHFLLLLILSLVLILESMDDSGVSRENSQELAEEADAHRGVRVNACRQDV